MINNFIEAGNGMVATVSRITVTLKKNKVLYSGSYFKCFKNEKKIMKEQEVPEVCTRFMEFKEKVCKNHQFQFNHNPIGL